MLRRAAGVTMAEVLAATGWPSVSMPQMARAAGIKLVTARSDGVTRYWAAESAPRSAGAA